ncbi:ABC transporter permease [Acidobacteria bacterium AB60]|nr:ABC transporter permease [Acidobacteria bacterium AB60]
MRMPGGLGSLFSRLFRRSAVVDDMAEELRSHIEHRADDLQRSGLDRPTAERRARLEFGAREKYAEESLEALGGNFVDTLLRDVRLAVRVLKKSPGFLIAAVFTLALGIGANAVVFGIMDGIVLRPLNVPDAKNLWGTVYGDDAGFQSYPNYVDLRDRNHSFEDLAAFNFVFAGLDTGKDPAMATGFAVTGNYFDVLRLQPFLGRFFHASDEHGPNSAPFVVLTHAYWRTRFHQDPGVVGRVVAINKHPFTIIGVAPAEFRGTLKFLSPEFFVPIVNQDQLGAWGTLTDRGTTHSIFEAFGHLKHGVTTAQATNDVNAIGDYLARTYPKEATRRNYRLARCGLSAFGTAVYAFVAALMVLAGLILLAACANLGGLFAAHAADRSREVAMRLALGSSRERIVRQLLTEALLISLCGGALGVMGSMALLRRLDTWSPFPGTPIHIPVNTDATIYGIALVLAIVSGLLFGIVPVRQILRANPYEVVKAGPGARLGRRVTVRDVLLVVQIALCAVLVTSSMVALRGLERSLHSDYGFDPRNTMLLGADLNTAAYRSNEILPTQKRLMEAMESIPGVERVGLVNNYPPLVYASASRENVYKDETRDYTQSSVAIMPFRYDVSPGYFDAASTALLAGRDFAWSDTGNMPPVAIVNRSFAQTIFGSVSNAIGHFVRMKDGHRVQVVGVVSDGKYLALNEDHQPALFLPSLQSPMASAYVVVRSHRDPVELASAMRDKLRKVDPGLPGDIQSWNSLLQVALFPSQMATASLGILGIMGAILSITGIFGMAAYSVSKRMREIGIRMALGAKRTEVLKTALGRAVRLLSLGSAAGLVLGILASRMLAYIVYQASSRDPLVLGAVVLSMTLLGLLATWIPAQRALAINPLILLREE